MNAEQERQWLLADLRSGHTQTSIDMPALQRFAEATETNRPDLLFYLRAQDNQSTGARSEVPWSLHVRSWKGGPVDWAQVRRDAETVDARRKRRLAELVKRGLVDAYWMGTGQFGKNDVGVTRVRCYFLKGQ